jgi:hypothetical protein
LQRLAVIEPKFNESAEPPEADLRILNELDGVYRFVIRADGIPDQPSDQAQKLEIIRF